MSSSRSSSPTLEALFANLSEPDSDIQSQQSQSSIPSVILEPVVADTNIVRPAFSSSAPSYHNPRHLGTLPFYFSESRVGQIQQTIASQNRRSLIIPNPYHSSVPPLDTIAAETETTTPDPISQVPTTLVPTKC